MTYFVGACNARGYSAVLRRQSSVTPEGNRRPALALQVALDRAGFSSGVIDGRAGANTRRAIEAYRQAARKRARAGRAAAREISHHVARYGRTVRRADPLRPHGAIEAAGARLPFDRRSPRRALSHDTGGAAPRSTRRRPSTPTARYSVPNVEPLVIPAQTSSPAAQSVRPEATGTSGRASAQGSGPAKSAKPASKDNGDKQEKPDVVVSVSRSAGSLTVTEADGTIVFFAPVTTGSEHDPLPIGEWKVNGVQNNPTFRYNPALFWDANPEPHEGDRSGGTERTRRTRVDRHLEGTLRPARLAGTVADWPHRIARLRSPDELGRAARRRPRQARHARWSSPNDARDRWRKALIPHSGTGGATCATFAAGAGVRIPRRGPAS